MKVDFYLQARFCNGNGETMQQVEIRSPVPLGTIYQTQDSSGITDLLLALFDINSALCRETIQELIGAIKTPTSLEYYPGLGGHTTLDLIVPDDISKQYGLIFIGLSKTWRMGGILVHENTSICPIFFPNPIYYPQWIPHSNYTRYQDEIHDKVAIIHKGEIVRFQCMEQALFDKIEIKDLVLIILQYLFSSIFFISH